jgi:hypothetical protein
MRDESDAVTEWRSDAGVFEPAAEAAGDAGQCEMQTTRDAGTEGRRQTQEAGYRRRVSHAGAAMRCIWNGRKRPAVAHVQA